MDGLLGVAQLFLGLAFDLVLQAFDLLLRAADQLAGFFLNLTILPTYRTCQVTEIGLRLQARLATLPRCKRIN